MKTENKGIIIPDFLIVMKWLEDGGKCMSDLRRELRIQYKHLHEFKKSFLKLGWITMVKDDRRHNLFLTEKGRGIVRSADILLHTMGYDNDKIKYFIEQGKRKKSENVDVKQLEKDIIEFDEDEDDEYVEIE